MTNKYLEKIAGHTVEPVHDAYTRNAAKYGLAGAGFGGLAGGVLGSGAGLIARRFALKELNTFHDLKNPNSFKAFIKSAPRALGKLGAEYTGKVGAVAGVAGGIGVSAMRKEASNQDPDYRPLASAALGGLMVRESTPALLGYTKVYHGTSQSAAQDIKRHGLDPSHGGTGASTIYDRYVDDSKGKSHVTRMHPISEMYARLSGESSGGPKTGEVLTARIPSHHWEKMLHDKDGGINKYMAATTADHIDSKYIAKSPLGGLKPHINSGSILAHIKAHPRTFGSGVLGLSTGGGLLYYGAKGLLGRLPTNQDLIVSISH